MGASEVVELKTAVETGIEELLQYAEQSLVPEVKQEIINQIPPVSNAGLIQDFLLLLICADWDDWESVLATTSELLVNEAVDAALSEAGWELFGSAFDALQLGSPLEATLAARIEDIVAAPFDGGGFGGIADELETFAQEIGDLVLDEGGDHRAEVVAAVNTIFDALHDEMAPGLGRDFILALFRELVLGAVPTVQDNSSLPPSLDYGIDSQKVANAIVVHCLYQVVLRDYYVDEANAAMFETLERAKYYWPEGDERYYWETGMQEDFFDYRDLMGPLADEDGMAWNALSSQEPLEEWAQTLDELVSILEPLSSALNTVASFYPSLEDTAEAVNGLIIALDSFQVLTHALEFGLKVQSMDAFGKQVAPLYMAVFPDDVVGGDVNGDAAVNAVDVQVVINAALGLNPSWSSDINKDRKINAVDVQLVINAALGIEILD